MVVATVTGFSAFEGNSGNPRHIFSVSLDQVPTQTIQIPWRIVSGSADRGGDTAYHSSSYTSGVLSFYAGQSPVKEVSYYISGDFAAENDESVVLELLPAHNVTYANRALTAEAVGWILDDDGTSNPLSMAISNPKVVEGSANQIVYTLTLSQAASSSLSVKYSLEGSATAGSDYNDKSGTVKFNAGETEKTVVVTLKNDKIAEGVEHLQLKVDLPSGIAEASGGLATIYDDDSINTARPFVTVAGGDAVEGDSSYQSQTFSIMLSQVTSETVTVPWRLINGTATLGGANTDTDYYTGGYASGTANIYAGSTQTTVTIYPKGDLTPEFDENFVLEILTPTNAQLAGNVASLDAAIWIRDNDGTAQPLSLRVSSPQVRETDSGTPTASFVLELSRAADRDYVFKYDTVNGTAKAGEDFVKTKGSVTILKGQRTAVVGVDIIADNYFESNETFSLKVTGSSQIKQISGGTATIVNDDLVTDFGRINGDSKNNTINGTNNAEEIRGKGGNDTVKAKGGDDKVWGDAGNDKLYGDAGDDTLRGGAGDDSIWGGAGNDKVYGDAGKDTIRGENGADRLVGGDGNDTIYGGAGNDNISGDAGNDKLYGDAGNDKVEGGAGKDTIYGGAGNDTLRGGKDADKLYGDAGNDRLYGDAGNDTMSGGAGNDRLYGGDGNDVMSGGAGADQFYFDKKDGDDTISDFEVSRDSIVITSGAKDVDDLDFSRVKNGIEISWGDTEIVLRDVAMNQVDDIDFIF